MTMTMDQAGFARLRRAAESGDASAQELLADLYARAHRAQEVRQWLARAAEAGLASAATRLGLWEVVGLGGIQSVARGLARIIACADACHADAAHTASILFGGGVGAPRDPREGLRRLVQAARLGQVRASAQLGLLIGAGHSSGAWLLLDAYPAVEYEPLDAASLALGSTKVAVSGVSGVLIATAVDQNGTVTLEVMT